jgi:flagellar hook-length control protein FliK
MFGFVNDKAALPFPAPETRSPADSLLRRRDNMNIKPQLNDFESYLKGAAKDKPVRENSFKTADNQAMERRNERVEYKETDSARQAVKEDNGPKPEDDGRKDVYGAANKNGVSNDQADTDNVSAQTPEQPVADDPASMSGGASITVIAAAQAQNITSLVQMPAMVVTELTEPVAGVQPVDTASGDQLTQLQVNLAAGELPGNQQPEAAAETVTGNQQNTAVQTAATGQNAADSLMGVTQQDTGAANGPMAAAFNQAMNEAMAERMAAETAPKDTGSREPAQSQVKTNTVARDGSKESALNSAVLEVFQDKVDAQAATKSLVQSKENLQQSLQNPELGKTLAAGAESKPLNLAVLQTQLAVGENPDKTGSVPVMPLQQHPLPGGQFSEITGATAPAAGKEPLFSQIMEHARLMLSGNQSELEMSLKPDHLGKLQLKVSIENQVVTARFVAESQQVKQIIETNLNQLRDQLRENGLQVDYLSVSVGTGTGDQLFSQNAGNQSQSGSGHDSRPYTDDMSGISLDGDTVPAPKSLQDTVIDLIA